MKITLLTVGKIKEKFLRDAIAEYSKRLSKYCKLEIIEVADEKTPDHASEVVEKSIRDKEGERLMRYIRDDDYVITLEIGGKMLDSVAFSRQLENLGIRGQSHICFVIGGSIGLGDALVKRSDYALSFSKMTFPHQLIGHDSVRTDLSFLPNHDQSALSQVNRNLTGSSKLSRLFCRQQPAELFSVWEYTSCQLLPSLKHLRSFL